jgi:bifunctional non-homologous end joining protein LigD
MLSASSPSRSGFIEPCLPSPADNPPTGSTWIHEIKHDGYRLMARRDSVGIRLITRRGNDWTTRFPLVVEAVNHLRLRSCLIDGEVVCCDENGVAAFQLLRHRAYILRNLEPSREDHPFEAWSGRNIEP